MTITQLNHLPPGARFRVVGRYFAATGTLLHTDQGRARVRWDGGAEHVSFTGRDGETVEFMRQRNRDDDAALTTIVEEVLA